MQSLPKRVTDYATSRKGLAEQPLRGARALAKGKAAPLHESCSRSRGMGSHDFFAFCTLLRPLELKALGELSQVRHLPAGEIIYRAGEASDSLFIINRGMVEIPPDPGRAVIGTYLSRGDIFGDVETLTELPRKNLVRACEPVSLRVFERESFPKILERVPSFFRYLSGQLAQRLLQATEAAILHSHCLELSGNLANFDLVTIYQTIVNSSQTGELSILDEDREMVAAFFFDGGVPRGGQFQHLIGEEAFWQLFLADDLRGTFTFFSGDARVSQSIQAGGLMRSSTEMLITALQARDEFQALRAEMPDGFATLQRQNPDLRLDDIPPGLHAVAQAIWKLPLVRMIPLDDLYKKLSVCEMKIYQAVHELTLTGQIVLASPTSFTQQVA